MYAKSRSHPRLSDTMDTRPLLATKTKLEYCLRRSSTVLLREYDNLITQNIRRRSRRPFVKHAMLNAQRSLIEQLCYSYPHDNYYLYREDLVNSEASPSHDTDEVHTPKTRREISMLSEEHNYDNRFSWLVWSLGDEQAMAQRETSFFVAVQLIEHNKAIFEIFYYPISDTFFWAWEKHGCFINSTKIHTMREQEIDDTCVLGSVGNSVQTRELLSQLDLSIFNQLNTYHTAANGILCLLNNNCDVLCVPWDKALDIYVQISNSKPMRGNAMRDNATRGNDIVQSVLPGCLLIKETGLVCFKAGDHLVFARSISARIRKHLVEILCVK